jgi:hypothetical protein
VFTSTIEFATAVFTNVDVTLVLGTTRKNLRGWPKLADFTWNVALEPDEGVDDLLRTLHACTAWAVKALRCLENKNPGQ